MKAMFDYSGLPSPKYKVFDKWDWRSKAHEIVGAIESDFSFPVFVKPARLGSSVGISRAVDVNGLWSGISVALHHDHKVIVEEGVDAQRLSARSWVTMTPSFRPLGKSCRNTSFTTTMQSILTASPI